MALLLQLISLLLRPSSETCARVALTPIAGKRDMVGESGDGSSVHYLLYVLHESVEIALSKVIVARNEANFIMAAARSGKWHAMVKYCLILSMLDKRALNMLWLSRMHIIIIIKE